MTISIPTHRQLMIEKNKIFAIEAMNDLMFDTEWRFSKGEIQMVIDTILEQGLAEPEEIYFRYYVFWIASGGAMDRKSVNCRELVDL